MVFENENLPNAVRSAFSVNLLPCKNANAEQTTKAELEDKPAPIGMFPVTNKFIPTVSSRP